MVLKAKTIPFTGSSDAEILIEIYVVTGKHSLFRVPESFCKECNMFYQAAKRGSELVEKEVEIVVKSYWTRFLRPLIKGGYHPPVMMLNGKVIAQGYEVPDPEKVSEKIESL